ncbi:MAG: DUF308 domain-containing protein [Bacilli bacterium]
MKKTFITTSLIYIVVGLFMVISPASISNLICYLLGLIILLFATNQIITFINNRQTSLSKFNLVLGVLATIFGIYLILNPELAASFIPLVAGVIITIDSISKLMQAFSLKKEGYSNWVYILITSIILLLFGLFLFFNPFKAVKLVIRLIGIVLIIDGISEIIAVNAFSRNSIIEAKIIK